MQQAQRTHGRELLEVAAMQPLTSRRGGGAGPSFAADVGGAAATAAAPPWLHLLLLPGRGAAAGTQPGGHLIDRLQPKVPGGRAPLPAPG